MAIHVPLIRRNIKDIKLLNFVPIPLSWEQQTCEVDANQLDIAVVTLTTKDDTEIFSLKCNPYKDELCLFTKEFENNVIGTLCAKRVLQGSSAENLAKFCPIKCQPSDANKIITKLTSTNFLLTNERNNFKILCKNETKTYKIEITYGTLDIKLPCNCKIILSDNDILEPEFPCIDRETELDIKRILPSAWINLKGLVIPPYNVKKFPTLENLDKALNYKAVVSQTKDSITDTIVLYVLLAVVIICNTIFITMLVYLYRTINRGSSRTPFIKDSIHSYRPAYRPAPPQSNASDSSYLRPRSPVRVNEQGSEFSTDDHDYVDMSFYQ